MNGRSNGLVQKERELSMRRMIVILGLLVAVCSAGAQQSKPVGKTYVLKAARMFDGKSNALVTPGLVVVTNGKISAVGANAAVPAGAEVIDLGDATLSPGFIDAHTHLTDEASDDWKQDALNSIQKTVAELALDATVYAKKTLMAGFTTVRDVGGGLHGRGPSQRDPQRESDRPADAGRGAASGFDRRALRRNCGIPVWSFWA
jgi:amidohydrolase family protein